MSTPAHPSQAKDDSELQELKSMLNQTQDTLAAVLSNKTTRTPTTSCKPEQKLYEVLTDIETSEIDSKMIEVHPNKIESTEFKLPQTSFELSQMPVKIKAKPSTYDGLTPWNNHLVHFETCADANNWTEAEKGMQLAISLRGQAQGALSNMPAEDRRNYRKLVKMLEERFQPSSQTELYRAQLKDRRRRATEPLPELGPEIRRLVNLVYPQSTVSVEVREKLARDYFLDALVDDEMKWGIQQSSPANLNEAVNKAVELESYLRRKQNVLSDQLEIIV